MNDARERKREQMRVMEAMLPEVRRELERLPNVDHVTVGAKEVNGIATDEIAFQVYVRVKKGQKELGPNERIPEKIGGFSTDVIMIHEGSLLAVDSNEYRPLCGGSQLEQSSGSGTLGAIALATAGSLAPVGAPVIVTNHHVAPNVGELVGQPSGPCDSWCCQCCDVGKVVATQRDGIVDVSIATLSNGIRFCHEVLELGAIHGSAGVSSLLPMDPLFKRGRTTGRTEGRFSSATASIRVDNVLFTNQIRITPAVAGTPFGDFGDSGSVILDRHNQVVGLLFSKENPPGVGICANRIDNVRSAMHIDFPLIGTPGAIPLAAGAAPDESDDIRNLWPPLRSRVMASEAGRQWSEIIARYRIEVGQLVRHNRATTTTWNRFQGPSFVSHYLKTIKDHGYLAPHEINGVRVENLLLAMATVLQDEGNPALAHAIWQHYLQIIESAQGRRTAEAFIDHLTKSSPAGAITERELEDCEASLVND